MFMKPGKALRIIGLVLFWLNIAAGVIGGIICLGSSSSAFLIVIFIPAGLLLAVIVGIPVIGLGDLIEDTSAIRCSLYAIEHKKDEN